jgi:hypothetical protein
MRQITILTALFMISSSMLYASLEKKYTQKEYIDQWKGIAVSQMIHSKIPASITMAQGILESGFGNSVLAQKANNHFGIKCHDWKGDTFFIDDDKPNECFRNYKNASESFKDHSEFLTGRSRYANLFTLKITDYKGWANGLKAAGYATNPKYPQLLIDLIERLNLSDLDKAAIETSNPIDYIASSNAASKVSVESQHTVMLHSNNIKYIVAKKGDTFYRISKEFKMGLWQLYRYNDYGDRKDVLEEGDIVYLQPKRRRSKKNATFSVTNPISMRTISQLEGIKLSSLMDKNIVASPDDLLNKGEKVNLR